MESVTLLVQRSLVFLNSSGQKIQVNQSPQPQEVPSWVVDTDTYKAAFKQGLVYAINYAAPPVVVEEKREALQALGFATAQPPTLDSVVKSGVPVEEAQKAMAEMSARQLESAPLELKDLHGDRKNLIIKTS